LRIASSLGLRCTSMCSSADLHAAHFISTRVIAIWYSQKFEYSKRRKTRKIQEDANKSQCSKPVYKKNEDGS
jgi:hypothetical protein